MKVVFLGVGEACDERLANTSVWMVTIGDNQKRSILLDCGFTVPSLYWQRVSDPEDLDALWVSHFHGDHFFGVPALLLRMYEMQRRKPLLILGQPSIEQLIHQAMDLAYPGFVGKLTYPLEFFEAEPGDLLHAVGLDWQFAENSHTQRDLAVRIGDGRHSIFYSGDGLPNPRTLSLAHGCDLIVHEAFRLEQSKPGHGTVLECIEFARKAGVSNLALVHIQRDERRERLLDIVRLLDQIGDIHVFLPEPGDELELK